MGMTRPYLLLPLMGVVFGAGLLSGQAQRKQTFAPHEQDGVSAPPAIVWDTPPLRPDPVEFESAEERHVRLVVVARELEQPWSMAFLPDGAILVTERPGRLRIIRNGRLDPQP